MTVETLKGIRGDQHLYLFWTKVTSKAGAIDVGEPALSRRRKAPMRFDDRLCEGDFTKTAIKDLHRQEYIEANDTIVACIHDWPDQPGHTILHTLESLLMKVCLRRSIMTRLWTSFATCSYYRPINRTSTKNSFASNCSCWSLTSMLWQQMEQWISFTWKSMFCHSARGSDC